MIFLDTTKETERFNSLKNELLSESSYCYAGALLQRAAQKFDQKPALITDAETVSFSELYKRATAVTLKLRAMDVQPGDRICVVFENSIDFYVAYYGAWQTGAIVAPLNTFLHEKELQHIVSDALPRVILASDHFAPILKAAITDVPMLTGAQMKQLPVPTESELKTLKIPQREPDELAALLYTSGTTGKPKGVMVTSRNILTNIAQGLARIHVHPDERVLGVLPLFHSFAQFVCVWGNIYVGGAVIVVPKIDRRFITNGLKHKPTLVMGVPALYGLFCLMRTIDFSTVRYFVTGGDAMPDKIRSAFEIIYRRRIVNGYGMTETSPMIAANFDDESCVANTVGRPVPGIECTIRDDQNREVKKGKTGLLWVKGDNVMQGYYQSPEQTASVMENGWLNTGDCAYFDEHDRIVISGRERDIIKNKGLIIYPQEIENVLLHHPAVFKAAVIGKRDESVGEIVVAFIAVREQVTGIEEQLKKLCVASLAAYKVPKLFFIKADLEMTALGKIDKKKLRKELETHQIKGE